MGSFARRVRTASGATAVQIVHKRGRRVIGIDHIGSAHDEDRLALLPETATQWSATVLGHGVRSGPYAC